MPLIHREISIGLHMDKGGGMCPQNVHIPPKIFVIVRTEKSFQEVDKTHVVMKCVMILFIQMLCIYENGIKEPIKTVF